MNLANMPGWIMTSQTVRAEALLFLLLSWCSTETAVPSDSLWDCLVLSLVKYVNETLTKWKSYFCAVLPVLAALSLEYVLYSVPESLKWSNWTLFQESEPLTRKEGRKWAQWKSPEAKNSPLTGYISGCVYFIAHFLQQTLWALPADFPCPA